MPESKNNQPLHGVTLEKIVTDLVLWYGWEKLGREIKIKCFLNDPSIKSSLTFLRRTPWARAKVESFYLMTLRRQAKRKERGQAPEFFLADA